SSFLFKFSGQVFVYSLGNVQIVNLHQLELVKEFTTCVSLDLGKTSVQLNDLGPLLGQGIVASDGAFWSHQRKIIAPELYMEKIKGMVNLITESAIALVNSWKSMIERDGGIMAYIKVDEGLGSFSADVISRACFGSNYSKGEQIFLNLRDLLKASSKKDLAVGIPGMRYLPTKSNRKAWALEKEIRNLILKVVKERQEAADEKDLLQMILEGAKNSNLSREETDRFIVDNCKNIYMAGWETTAVSASWCLMLLGVNQEWQDRVRAEVLEICGGSMPDYDMIRKMKLLHMVIHETLRLYTPVPLIAREALKDMKLGNINVPKGVNIWTMVSLLHTDPEIWGSDSYKFNPERFANGIAGACKYPFSYMPFGAGPRVCLGQHFATVELKILLALILSNFSFTISPRYVHSPIFNLVVKPDHGVNLLVKKL
ncbi:LOW QUALITY PROTEIN: cytochrome P450 714C2-like, partial [Manihot esculenta]|uniref:LOW QUALITY PROTEIN: cytochrome P450 714C2-like n=1 Tax=Manihot esculenta TaxID=3983 RepID=UPI001CC3E578